MNTLANDLDQLAIFCSDNAAALAVIRNIRNNAPDIEEHDACPECESLNTEYAADVSYSDYFQAFVLVELSGDPLECGDCHGEGITHTYNNEQEVRTAFWQSHPECVECCTKQHNHYDATTRTAFNMFVDGLARNEDISDTLAREVTL